MSDLRSTNSSQFCASVLLILTCLTAKIDAAEPPIIQVALIPESRVFQMSVPSDANQYFQLESSKDLSIFEIIAVSLGTEGKWSIAMSENGRSYFRVKAVSVEAPEDSDRDGIDDVFELLHSNILHPLNGRDASEDPDSDGLPNGREVKHGSNPELADTDSDGWGDRMEVEAETDPADPKSRIQIFSAQEVQLHQPGVFNSRPQIDLSIPKEGIFSAVFVSQPEVNILPYEVQPIE